MLRPFDAGSTSVFPLLERSIGDKILSFKLPSTAEISVYSQDMMAQDTKELLERVLNYNATTTGLSTDSIGIFGEVNGCYNTTKTWYGKIRPWDFLLGPAYPSYNGQGPLSDQASIASENVLSSVYNDLSKKVDTGYENMMAVGGGAFNISTQIFEVVFPQIAEFYLKIFLQSENNKAFGC